MAEGQAFCATCHALQPPSAADHFARLEIAPAFEIDLGELDRVYFGLQRQFHPDRFANRSATEQLYSAQHATSLNRAYEVLRAPLARAEYLLAHRGIAVRDPASTIDDPKLLHEALEAREALDRADTPAAVDLIIGAAEDEVVRCLARLAEAFTEDVLDLASELTMRLRYLDKLLVESRARRARLAAAAAS